MREGDWEKVVEMATALNASEELQAEFNEDPRTVLSRYDIQVTDEELADIRRVLDACADSTTARCFVPLARPHGNRTKDREEN